MFITSPKSGILELTYFVIFDMTRGAEHNNWQQLSTEGQIHLDVLEQGDNIVVLAPMAGVIPKTIDVSVHGDLLTIKGERDRPDSAKGGDPYLQECFWGSFSRSVVLPVAVKGDLADASMHHGLLVIEIPKQRASSRIPITVVDE